jgi:regulator of replication initiation timing
MANLENKVSNYKGELKRVKFDLEQLNTQMADLRDKNNLLRIDNTELEQKVSNHFMISTLTRFLAC